MRSSRGRGHVSSMARSVIDESEEEQLGPLRHDAESHPSGRGQFSKSSILRINNGESTVYCVRAEQQIVRINIHGNQTPRTVSLLPRFARQLQSGRVRLHTARALLCAHMSDVSILTDGVSQSRFRVVRCGLLVKRSLVCSGRTRI